MNIFDNQTLPLPCPNCGNQQHKTVAWIKANDTLHCPCGTEIRLDREQLLDGLRSVENRLKDLQNAFRK